ncbi:argininosuccinate synthase [bacterium]|nr:argininosuccinate synthase [bacterium]
MNTDNHKPLAVLAFSGGLDTSFCAVWLREQGFRVHSVHVNTGGLDETAIQAVEQRALQCGAEQHVSIDAREDLFNSHLRFLLYANARRGAGYPLCVSSERLCQAMHVARHAKTHGADAIVHGSTGAGNDQLRFDTVFQVMAAQCSLLTPVRELALSRAEEVDYLAQHGVEVDAATGKYSVNAGMWGLTVGGIETHSSWESLPAEAWPMQVCPDKPPVEITLGFERGIPVSLNGEELAAVEIIEKLNEFGASYGIGRGMHLGDTVLGIKGRVGYSAPAAHILIEAHRELEKLTLSAAQQFWKESLGNLYGKMVHEGQALDPLCADLEALLESSQKMVSGQVRILLRNDSLAVLGSRSPNSLMAIQPAAYGEQTSGWSGAEVAAHNRLHAMQMQLCWQQKQKAVAGAEL